MIRVSRDGKTLNKRTLDMLERAEARLGLRLWVIQGSYNRGVGASAGTHDGGGAIDVSPTGDPREVVRQLRLCGFAAWYRTPAQGDWSAHIHAIAIGDADLSSGARNQVSAYYAGRNGLASNAPDDGPRIRPIPVWPIKLARVGLVGTRNQFKAKNKKPTANVRRTQRCLNERLGTNLAIDGIAGPRTKGAYAAWEKKIGGDGDGIPGRFSLGRLIAGYYRLRIV